MPTASRYLRIDRGIFWAGTWAIAAYFPLTVFVAPRLDVAGSVYVGFSIVLLLGVILLVLSVIPRRARSADDQTSVDRTAGQPRRIDVALSVALAVCVGGTLLVGTGVVPTGLYPASGSTWDLAMNPCDHLSSGESNSFAAMFPIWSTVHVDSSDANGALFWLLLEGGSGLNGEILGYGGVWSFVSDGQPILVWVLSPLPPNNETSCPTTIIVVTVQYST